ncbi:Ig-like domain-containing protein [Corallococcus silvisoli]|uniref:Ig-like domain-containing protein n=1 Tax=Corallococcus silvisoli TaxID=2697031 RepID=UPI001377935F|nr:putative Ig domain-containing protein [Corallococcus silvisoli]NBD14512.1 hypothetical protein [Corallococcus silvisoli]
MRRLSSFLLSWLLIGLGATSCRDDVPPAPNRPPTLTGPTPQATRVTSGASVSLTLEALDLDGDMLTYVWIQLPESPAGTFDTPTAASPSWTAPMVTSSQRFALRVTVSDGRGGSVQGAVDMEVTPPVAPNNPPTVSPPTATPVTVNEQQSVALAVIATDTDGDPLTYAWEQVAPTEPAGSFSDPASAVPTWTAPAVEASGTYTLRVTVSDGNGGSAQGTVEVSVQHVP